MKLYETLALIIMCVGYASVYIGCIIYNIENDGFIPSGVSIIALIAGLAFMILLYGYHNGHPEYQGVLALLSMIAAPAGIFASFVACLWIIAFPIFLLIEKREDIFDGILYCLIMIFIGICSPFILAWKYVSKLKGKSKINIKKLFLQY